jgi:ABC-type multidrug transport system fused ATPase/permease subunit
MQKGVYYFSPSQYSYYMSGTVLLHQDFVKKRKAIFFLFLLTGLVQSIAAFLLPVSIGEFFAIHFHSSGSKGKLLGLLGIHFKSLTFFFLFFLLLLVVKAVFEYGEKYIAYQQGELYVKNIREEIFAVQMNWHNENFRQKHFGKYLLRYSNDMKAIQNYLTKGIMGFAKDTCFLLLGFLLLAAINLSLSLYLFFVTAVIMGAVFLLSKTQKKLITGSRTKRSSLLALVTKSFQRHSSIKTNSAEEVSIERFNKISGELYDNNMLNNRFESMLFSFLPMLQFLMIGSLLMIMTSAGIQKEDALVFVLITLMMMSPMKRILKVPAIINKGKISLNKINEILLNNAGDKDGKQLPVVITIDEFNQN